MQLTNQRTQDWTFLQTSVKKRMLLVTMHILSVIAVYLTSLSLEVRVILLAGIGLSLIFWIWDYNLRGHEQIRFSEQAGWQLKRSKGAFFSIRILPASIVTLWCIVLLFENGGRRQTLIIFNDELPARDFRRLIVLIKTSGLKKE
jgi:membrane-bound toxin of toxin-antitoxin system